MTASGIRTFGLGVVALFFTFIFASRIDIGLPVHLGHMSVILLLALGWRYLPKLVCHRQFVILSGVFIVVGLYHSVIGTVVGTRPFLFLQIMLSIPFYIAFGFLLRCLAFDERIEDFYTSALSLFRLYIYCVASNSALILFEAFFPSIKEVVESVLVQDPESNIDYATHPFRLRGLAAGGGAALSIANGIAIWLCLALVMRHRIEKISGSIMALTIAFSNLFTGRTGLVIGAVFVALFLAILFVSGIRRFRLSYLAAACLFVGAISIVFMSVDLDREVTGWAIDPLWIILEAPSQSDDLNTQKEMWFLPPHPLHLLFGVGYFSGFNVLYPATDSGYIKTLLAVGAPLALLIYGLILFLLLRVIKTSPALGYFLGPVMFVLFLVEIKEPFLYQNFAARLIFALIGFHLAALARDKLPTQTRTYLSLKSAP
jgi:hypothetical protein